MLLKIFCCHNVTIYDKLLLGHIAVTDRIAWCVSLSCHSSEPCKNGSSDRDAVWVKDSDSDRPKEPCIRCPIGRGKGEPIVKCHATWQFLGERICLGVLDDTLPRSVWDAAWVVDSVGPKKRVLGGVQSGEYHWAVHVWRRCGLFCQITLTTCSKCAIWPNLHRKCC